MRLEELRANTKCSEFRGLTRSRALARFVSINLVQELIMVTTRYRNSLRSQNRDPSLEETALVSLVSGPVSDPVTGTGTGHQEDHEEATKPQRPRPQQSCQESLTEEEPRPSRAYHGAKGSEGSSEGSRQQGAHGKPLGPDWLCRLRRVGAVEARWSGPATDPWRKELMDLATEAALAAKRALKNSVLIESIGTTLGAEPIAGFTVTAGLGGGLGICEARFCPGLSAALIQALTGSLSSPIVTRPDPVTSALLGHAALLLCRAMGESDIAHPRLVSNTRIHREPVLAIELRLRIGDEQGHMQLRLDQLSAMALADALEIRAKNASSSSDKASGQAGVEYKEATEGSEAVACDSSRGKRDRGWPDCSLPTLTAPLFVCMGPVRLSAASVSRLRPGDVICPDPEASLIEGAPSGSVFLRACASTKARPCAIGRLDSRCVSVTHFSQPRLTAEEMTMSKMCKEAGSLAIDVHVVLDTIPMTLGELSRVGPGSVITLTKTAPRAKLQAGEQTIALCELVDVEGVLGVRIIEGADL